MQRTFQWIRSGRRSTCSIYNSSSSHHHHLNAIPAAATSSSSSSSSSSSHYHLPMKNMTSPSPSTHLHPKNHGHAFHSSMLNGEKIIPFHLADIGEGILEVEVLQWFVKEGETIHQFDKVAQVQSDKATVEITSRYDGVVKKIHHQIGDMAQVGQPLIDIATEESVTTTTAAAPAAAPQDQKGEIVTPTTGTAEVARDGSLKKVLTTPAVRHIARQKGIDLAQVPATGRNGRILKEDVLNFLQNGVVSAATTSISTPTNAAAAAAAAAAVPLVGGQATEGDRVEKVRGITKAMIKSMTASTQIPHLGLSDEVELDNLIALRQELKELSTEERLTFMPFFIKAASLALEKYPILNAQLSGDQTEIIYKRSHNVGIAMDTPQGLLVPNIKNVNKLTVYEVAKELNRLIALGKEGMLGPEDLKGGTFTLSNIGSIGGTYTRPVLTSPEVLIGAIGKTQKLPRFNDKGEVVPVSIMYISWSADHRIIDGATITRFSNLWKEFLEQPLRILYGN